MSRTETFTEEDVLNFLGNARHPASVREIASALSLKHAARRRLASVLSRLKRQHLVEELRGGQYRLAGSRPEPRAATKPAATPGAQAKPAKRDPNQLAGKLVAHRDGYGFVVPESPRSDLDGDLFIPPDQLGDAMHGDRVLARIERRDTRHAPGSRRAPKAT